MNFAAQALLWKNWQLTWRPVLLQQLIVIAGFSLFMVVVYPNGPDADALAGFNLTVHALVLVSLLVLLGASSAIPVKSGDKNYKTGFPHRQEYVLPISTALLVIVPLVYFCLLFVFAYVFPMLVISALFDVTGPQFIFTVLLFESILTILALSWWTTNGVAHTLGWIVVILLYWNQARFLGFSISEETHTVVLASLTQLIVPTLITTALLGLMFFGVKQQRCGDNVFGFEQEHSNSAGRFLWRNLFPFALTSCPTDSNVAAELWRERQLRGFSSAGFNGILVAFTALLFMRVLSLYGAFDGEQEDVLIIPAMHYFLLALVMGFQAFGVSMRNGTPHFSVFDRTVPLATAKLVAIKLSVNIAGLVVAAIAMLLVVWLFGSLSIDGFDQIKTQVLDRLAEFVSTPPLALARVVVIYLTGFATVAVLWAALGIWFMLRPPLMSWIVSVLAVYAFLLAMFIARITEGSEFGTLSSAINIKHLWVFMLGMPAIIVFLYRQVIRDRLLNVRQLLVLSVIGLLLALLQISYLASSEFYVAESPIEVLVSTSLLGVLPLVAILMALWTMSSLRHH